MSEGSERSTRIGWTVSSYSGRQGECVECNQRAEGVEGQVLLRDTKHRDHGMLAFSDQEWAGFLGTVAPK